MERCDNLFSFTMKCSNRILVLLGDENSMEWKLKLPVRNLNKICQRFADNLIMKCVKLLVDVFRSLYGVVLFQEKESKIISHSGEKFSHIICKECISLYSSGIERCVYCHMLRSEKFVCLCFMKNW